MHYFKTANDLRPTVCGKIYNVMHRVDGITVGAPAATEFENATLQQHFTGKIKSK